MEHVKGRECIYINFSKNIYTKEKEATIWRQSLPEIHKEYWRTTL